MINLDSKKPWAPFKVSLELDGKKRISGNNLFNLLDNIMDFGSISSAASRLGFSYRYAWGLIREAENAMGIKLVEKQLGGHAGGGTSLTKEGKELLAQYKPFKEELDSQLNKFSNKIANPTEKQPSDEMAANPKQSERNLLLASTMEPVEAGLLDLLENTFYQKNNILVRHIALGSGRALEIARQGRVDITLTHAPKLEEEFMNEGWGLTKVPLMANDFIMVGPTSDPAKLEKAVNKSVPEIFKQIALSESSFISRGDHSGTHLREQEIWETTGIAPTGSWYYVAPGVAGNLGVLRMASENGAYTLVDRASYLLSNGNKNMKVYASKVNTSNIQDKKLLDNVFTLTLVNPERAPNVNHQDAALFVQWLQREGKKIIAGFGEEKFGEPLFTLDL